MSSFRPLYPLAAAQFVMVLDTAVMSVSISQLVEDFDTTVSTIQFAISLYALVMASLMITGGKLGDIWGRRRTFRVGLVIYGIGSLMTALAPTIGVLILGWSIIEGVGAALVLPALGALVANNFEGKARATAFGIIGGIAGVGIAVGPLLGGWVTTYYSWRYVFAGEVLVVIFILVTSGWIKDAAAAEKPRLDWVGSLLSATGIMLIVLGVLQSSTWGWFVDKNSPIAPFGFALTPFVIAAGFVLLWAFVSWNRRVERRGGRPLVYPETLRIPTLKAGLLVLLAQNLILLGIFFAVPLYLQVVLGHDAFETGLRLLPTSLGMLVTASLAPSLARSIGPRMVVRLGLGGILLSALWLTATVSAELNGLSFGLAMLLLGIGLGLMASQLGNVVQSSVSSEARSEAGGLQFTASNLGSALGTALIGSIVIGVLAAASTSLVTSNPDIADATEQQALVQISDGVEYVPPADVAKSLEAAGVPASESAELVGSYSAAQLVGLKAGLLACAAIALLSFPFTRRLPRTAGELSAVDEVATADDLD